MNIINLEQRMQTLSAAYTSLVVRNLFHDAEVIKEMYNQTCDELLAAYRREPEPEPEITWRPDIQRDLDKIQNPPNVPYFAKAAKRESAKVTTCITCDGNGAVANTTCQTCDGAGYLKHSEAVRHYEEMQRDAEEEKQQVAPWQPGLVNIEQDEDYYHADINCVKPNHTSKIIVYSTARDEGEEAIALRKRILDFLNGESK